MDLSTLTSGTPTTKPWMTIVAKSVTTDILSANSFNVQNLTVGGDLEVKGDEKVDGYAGSLAENVGSVFLSTSTGLAATPAGTSGGQITYDSTNNKVTESGITGVNPTATTTDGGATWSQPVLPVGVITPFCAYSPTLNYYTLLDGTGNSVYTSPQYLTGTFTAAVAFAGTFDIDSLVWMPQLGAGKFITNCTDLANRVVVSPDGTTWSKIPSNRRAKSFSYSDELKTLVVVGEDGPMYSLDDGKTFVNSAQSFSMSGVCWSSYLKMFIATPRAVNLLSIYTSVDGKVWVNNANSFPVGTGNVRCICWCKPLMLLVAAGDNETVLVSQDGLHWKRLAITGGLAWYGAEYVEPWGQLYLVGIQAFVRVCPRRFLGP